MKNSLMPFLILLVVQAFIVLVLAVRRKTIASHVDSQLQHVLEGGGAQPPAEAHKLDQIDKWGKILTIVAVVYAVLLGLLYLYQGWNQTAGLGA
jgi:hypothetical protein